MSALQKGHSPIFYGAVRWKRTGVCFLMPDPEARRTEISTVVTSPSLAPNLVRLAVGQKCFIYHRRLWAQEYLCTFANQEAHCYFFSRDSRQKVNFSGYCLGTNCFLFCVPYNMADLEFRPTLTSLTNFHISSAGL